MYDAIIVGARCAGASTAMLLSRKGYRVLLVDKTVVGQNVPQGHFIHRLGPQRLAKWGILDQVVATNCPLVQDILMSINDVPLHGTNLMVENIPFGLGPRRGALDWVLVQNAIAAGVELRDRFVVDELITDGERVLGIRGRDLRTGRRVEERGKITIGADGRNSKVARAVGALSYEVVPSVSCYYFSYWSGVQADKLELYISRDFAIFAFPTNDNLLALFIGWPIERFHTVRADIEASFMATVDKVPELAARVRSGARTERFYGTADLPNFFRKPFGDGWALVGDAGHHKDPFLALGIADALRDAELVADAVHQSLSGKQAIHKSLAQYERQRNAASLSLYSENLARARFTPPPPEQMQLRRALVENGDQNDINAFYRAMLGLAPLETFFNPKNVGRIVGRTVPSEKKIKIYSASAPHRLSSMKRGVAKGQRLSCEFY